MTKHILICFLILTSTLTSWAEPRAYVEPGGFFRASRIFIDGKEVEHSFFIGWRNLPEHLSADPEAKALAEQYETRAFVASTLLWGGLAAALTYAAVTDSDDYKASTYWTIFLSTYIPSLVIWGSASGKLQNALNHYNGIKPDATTTTLKLTPTANGAALALSF